MKHVLAVLGILILGVVCLLVASPAKGQAVVSRIVHYIDPVPPPLEDASAPPPAEVPAALAPAISLPPWRQREIEGDRAYEAGDFAAAAADWSEASPKAPPADAMRLRNGIDRARLFYLLAAEPNLAAPPAPEAVPGDFEREYRRLFDAMKNPTAGTWLELAEFARVRNLRGHLAYDYERAYEQRVSSDEVQQKVVKILRRKKAEHVAPPKEVLDAVIGELPTSEAAEIAREETDAGGRGGTGIGGVESRGDVPPSRAEDGTKAAEAYRLMKVGESEYRLAVPGTKDVNKHRRAALDAYTKARNIFDELDRLSGFETHQREVHDCNQSIVELQKDLPIGK